MAINPSPNFDPNTLIPNNPFFYPETWALDTPSGALITGSGILVDPLTGTVSAAAGPNPPGTVTLVTAGVGIATTPVTGITTSGSIQLAPVSGLTSGTYNYMTATVDTYGRVISAMSSATPVQVITANSPIYVTGAAPNPTININLSSTSQVGAVQLRDDTTTPSTTLALTANQGYQLQQQINTLSSVLGNQFLAGTLDPSTGNVVTATVAGNLAGVTAGNPLPPASTVAPPPSGNLGADIIITGTGSYNPPGGSGPYSVVAGDKFISDGTTWAFLPVGFRAPYATTTSSGVIEIATTAETQALSDFTLAVTPGTLGTLIATTTQKGIIELATDAETTSLAASDVVVTPSNLNALQASTTQRGIVQLAAVLGTGSTTQAPTADLLDQVNDNMIPKTIIDANGDLIVGQAADTPAILPKGPNGSVLTVDVTHPLGLDWNVPNAPDSVPVGGVIWFTSDDPANMPVGYVLCDGGSYSTAAPTPGTPNPYYDLFTVIGYTFGGAGANFNVPDLQGQFIRGYDPTGSVDDPARVFGSNQGDEFKQHTHTTQPHNHTTQDHDHTTDPHNHSINPSSFKISTATVTGNDNGLYRGNRNFGFLPPTMEGGLGSTNSRTVTVNDANVTVDNTTVIVDNTPTTAPTPDETRPKNVALLPIIKYTNSP